MKFNKFKSLAILCFVLLIFAGLSCVSAQDVNETSQNIVFENQSDALSMMPSDDDFYSSFVKVYLNDARIPRLILSRG